MSTQENNSAAFLPELPQLMVEEAVKAALLEDFGRAGDITSQATIPAEASANAQIVSRQHGILAGSALADAAFRLAHAGLAVTWHKQDGQALAPGDVAATIQGPARGLLAGERVALNFLGHLSGIASATQKFAAKIAHTKCNVVCTRKTTPGLRAFEKYAVRCGGGASHRFGLDDAILIKDNHIAVAGGVAIAIERARAFAGHLVKIEVEVDTLEQLHEALSAKPDVVMLDNMGPELLREAVQITQGRALLEASGGITLESVGAIAQSGVDVVSTGWLTHSAPVLDLGLDIHINT
ncbi:carboxylating nicotinate-nucleotide diphosphorylase [Polycladidibacter hongkongensis]|uniref:carboxylating nicotinate-nucleotide diphosphorylase n=1 Tax=Polycladidibacter hongkongensis TaxID=1647556 RepID=UPI000836C52A|nr:carboxylating nicotinate-nucleotide diphosphorylase [Pseudovibrio hongkongensis]